MAPALKILSLLQLLALFCCICAVDNKVAAEGTSEDISKNVESVETDDDLDTEETGWMVSLDPIQRKLRDIEQVKAKLLSPFMTLKSPTFNYGGGYPMYSNSGSSGLSTGARYPGSPPYYWSKPVKTVDSSYSKNGWYNKGFSGINFQQGTSAYTPNCDHSISSWKPITITVPVNPTYSVGTPLNTYHSSASPTQTYGTPLINFSAKPAISSSSSQSGSPLPLSQAISVPVLISDTSILKSSDLRQFGGYQNVNPSSYWSSAGSLPSSSSWGSTSGSLPSQPSSLTSSNPAWSGAAGYFPFSSGTPQSPVHLSPSSPWISEYYPIPVSGSQVSSYVPTTPSPPTWPATAPSSQQPTQAPSIPFASYFPQGFQYSTQSPIAQQYSAVSSSPVPLTASDQSVVRITPPPAEVKSNVVSNLPGSNIVVPVDSSIYSPGNSYFGSYYPNVFYITNEQHIDAPNSSEVADQERSSLKLSSESSSALLENTNTELPLVSNKAVSTTPQHTNLPVQTKLYPSSPAGQPTFTVYSIPPAVISSSGFYSSPVQGSYPIPVSSALLGTSSLGMSQSPSLQFIPATRTRTPMSTNSIPWGYRYNAPSISFQGGFRSDVTAKAAPPC